MLSLLLFEDFLTRLSQPNVITGMILAALGLALALLSKYITRSIRKKEEIDEADKVYLGLKGFALVLILVAMIFMIIK